MRIFCTFEVRLGVREADHLYETGVNGICHEIKLELRSVSALSAPLNSLSE